MNNLIKYIKSIFSTKNIITNLDNLSNKIDRAVNHALSAEDFSKQAIQLFKTYKDSFGLPDDNYLELQCEFEAAFAKLVCFHEGHEIIKDMCGKYEHDFCPKCDVQRDEIIGYVKRDCRNQ